MGVCVKDVLRGLGLKCLTLIPSPSALLFLAALVSPLALAISLLPKVATVCASTTIDVHCGGPLPYAAMSL